MREARPLRDLQKAISVHRLIGAPRRVEEGKGICRSILPGTRALSVPARLWSTPSPGRTEIGRSGCTPRRRSGGDQLGCDRSKALVIQVGLVICEVTEKRDWRELPLNTTEEIKHSDRALCYNTLHATGA